MINPIESKNSEIEQKTNEVVSELDEEARKCGLGKPVRCGGSLRCRNWRGFPDEQLSQEAQLKLEVIQTLLEPCERKTYGKRLRAD